MSSGSRGARADAGGGVVRSLFGWTVAAATLTTPALVRAAGKDEPKLRKIAAAYGTCVVRKHHDKASEAVLATASNHAITHQMSQIIDSDCLGSAAGSGVDMHFPNDTYQYALADALVRMDFADHGETSFTDRLPLAQPVAISSEKQAEELAKAKNPKARDEVSRGIEKHNALVWLSRYGECVVRQDPVNARYWLLTPAETPEETSRIKAMQPAFSACLDGGTLRFTRTVIRGTVAINYYRLARATAMPAAGSVH